MDGPPPFDLAPHRVPTTGAPSVWHYTDAVGLISIVEKHRLWASSPLALNDSKEVVYGAQMMRDIYEREVIRGDPRWSGKSHRVIRDLQNPSWRSMYVLCASLDGDSLNQWQGYAGQQGYAIELDTSVPLHVETPGFEHFAAGWYDVAYEVTDQRELILDSLRRLDEAGRTPSSIARIRLTRRYFDLLAARLKDRGFRHEEEVRFITNGGEPVKFRAGRHGVIPYVELQDVSGRLPILSVKCGPTASKDTEAIMASVRELLAAKGYNTAAVAASEIPFR